MIQIDERMHTVPQVAEIIGHGEGYVHQLIESGHLKALRPPSPNGRPGQWRIYPESVRTYLHAEAPKKRRQRSRRAEAEAQAARALFNSPAVL